MHNVLPRDVLRPVPDAYLLVTTNEAGTVDFDVTTMFGGVTNTAAYQVTSADATRINFRADDVYVTDIQVRDRAVRVQSRNNKKIGIHVINDEFRSTDGYVALPCDGMTVPSDFRSYQYLILSTSQMATEASGSLPRASQFLIITCEGDTTVTVTPSTRVSSGGAFQDSNFGPGTSRAESNWRIVTPMGTSTLIPTGQTLLIEKDDSDFTGTLVVGDKPLIVLSGHECGQVPRGVTACDHMTTQIPPHTTWGYTFLLSPLSGRSSGDFYRFATNQDNTEITITCVDAGGNATSSTTRSLSSALGSNWGQFETHSQGCDSPYIPKYCCLESTKPVVVAQYSYGYTRDSACNGEISDPFITLVPPVIQYLHQYHLVPVNVSSESSGPSLNHFYSVTVPTRYFQPASILLDDVPLEDDATQWQAIQCTGGRICGYGITKRFNNEHHILYHADDNAALFVHTYGFTVQNSYALAGGMELQPISG